MGQPESPNGLNIFVDESGTFVLSPRKNTHSVVAAYVVPDRHLDELAVLVTALRADSGGGAETKLRDLPDERYSAFLADLDKLNGLAFAVAVDVGLHLFSRVENHRNVQASKIREHVPKMLFEEGRNAVTSLADGIEKLPCSYIPSSFVRSVFFTTSLRVRHYISRSANLPRSQPFAGVWTERRSRRPDTSARSRIFSLAFCNRDRSTIRC
ncbi:hypothetical protein [Paraburkholderia tropica]|uniref:hypothetical protein n=1 Tax=Paraburkholderia tropica TaxID=92647 RepID=UPI002AB0A8A2|nr:hypothetical protein [Paraburkholderia tropica]